jgi:hypothetical protein
MNNLSVQQIGPIPNTLDDLVAQINESHDQVEKACTAAVGHALKAGQFLLEAKGQLNHGEFKPWIEANLDLSDRMARAYMRVAEKFPELPDEKRQRVADMSLRGVLKLLASPKDKADTQSDKQPESPDNIVISLAEVEIADLVAELETRDPRDAEQALLMRVRQWADAAENEIIVRPKKADESETTEQNSTENAKDDLTRIPLSLDRRNVASSANHDEEIPPQPRN